MNDEENISYFSNFSNLSSLSSSPEHTVRACSMQTTSKHYFKVIFKQLEIHIYVKEILPIWI